MPSGFVTRYVLRTDRCTGTQSYRDSLPASPACFLVGVFAWDLDGGLRHTRPLASEADVPDEILFYEDERPVSVLRHQIRRHSPERPLQEVRVIPPGWDIIVGIDLDGGGQDEILVLPRRWTCFATTSSDRTALSERSSMVARATPQVGTSSRRWISTVTARMRSSSIGTMACFSYYDIRANGSLGAVIRGGDGYTSGWDSITAVDLDGDHQDEFFFYRDDGLYRFYNIASNASLPPAISGGTGYSPDWASIVAIDLDGDARDEMMFYRSDGLFRYYDVRLDGTLGGLINGGTGYTAGWDVIAPVELHGDQPLERVSRFTTFFDCCQNRVTNIRTIAKEIDGTVVLPGETFSIDAITGPRTSSGGYLPAPYLINGESACCAVGGGVSQFGTTIHNAVFWGGYQVVRHQPHSGWISRYPLGIEATLVYSSIDYRFRNDTPNPVVVRTSSTSTSVTVEIWGNQGGWQVGGFHPRGNERSKVTVLDNGGSDAKRVSATVTGDAPGTGDHRQEVGQGRCRQMADLALELRQLTWYPQPDITTSLTGSPQPRCPNDRSPRRVDPLLSWWRFLPSRATTRWCRYPGLTVRPLHIASPDGDSRLFVVERGGRVEIVKGGAALTTPFINIANLLTSPRGGEQGTTGVGLPSELLNKRSLLPGLHRQWRRSGGRRILSPPPDQMLPGPLR